MKKINFNQKLIIRNKNNFIYQTTETQPLYLYPLTLKDYVDNLNKLLPIKLDIIKIDDDIDYNEYLSNKYFNNLLSVELNIDSKDNLDTIEKIILILATKKIKISLNIKDITKLPLSFFKTLKNKITYFKIYWNYNNYLSLLKRLDVISNEEALILIKSYLKLEEIDNYKNYIEDFKKSNVDIFQLSKELLPIGQENIIIDDKYEIIIRKLEKEYSSAPIIFKSVKNLKELYYPRFELDERNSRKCYACRLKPYLYNKTLIPCKVIEKINNISLWGIEDFNDLANFYKCGIKCDDCASIYENDILNEINDVIKDIDDIEIIIEGDKG